MQHLAGDSHPDLYKASAIRARMTTETNRKVSGVVAATMAGPDEQRRPSPLCSMLSSLVRNSTVFCLFCSFIALFVTDAGSTWSRGCVAADSSRTSPAARFEQVMYTLSIFMASHVAKESTKRRYRLSGENFFTSSLQHTAELADRDAHRVG